MESYPSIFNDVIGPVMRGPSSSHCAASLRIARIARDLMDGKIENILIEFDPNGSLATTHKDQGSDMGLFGGFLGWDADDGRLPDSEKHLFDAGIAVAIEIVDIGAAHPNTYRITLSNSVEKRRITAISTGGGMIEIVEIDGAAVSQAGDFFVTLIFCDDPQNILEMIGDVPDADEINTGSGERNCVEIKSRIPLDHKSLTEQTNQTLSIRTLKPVLPVLSRKDLSVPFINCEEMFAYNESRGLELWELATHYEAERGAITQAEVFEKMRSMR